MRVIVGLGNPGDAYQHTRHNAGFDVIEVLSQKLKIPMTKLKCKAVVGEGSVSGERIALARPQTYMNDSGRSVVELVNWYKPAIEELLVIYDDVDLPAGKLRVRAGGSAGTHNGMRSILYLLGREDFARVRVGIGAPPPHWDIKDYVLSHYTSADERKLMFDSFVRAADAAQCWIAQGAEAAMRNYNG